MGRGGGDDTLLYPPPPQCNIPIGRIWPQLIIKQSVITGSLLSQIPRTFPKLTTTSGFRGCQLRLPVTTMAVKAIVLVGLLGSIYCYTIVYCAGTDRFTDSNTTARAQPIDESETEVTH